VSIKKAEMPQRYFTAADPGSVSKGTAVDRDASDPKPTQAFFDLDIKEPAIN
jgi:hypothetical protein